MPQYPPDTQVTRATDRQTEVLIQLNKTIQAASASSDRLARALNLLTLCGTIVAALGVAVAVWHHWSG
jgi:predicted lysophospholipase L1 biosynthesis ABC-type transport system permease subunit